MAISGASLVGGEKELESKLTAWGYMTAPGVQTLNDAVALYETTYAPAMDERSLLIHHRNFIPGDDIGPVTATEINGRTCSVPDAFNAEEANWPDQCRNEINVSWNFERLPGLDQQQTAAAWRHCVDHPGMYNKLFQMALVLTPGEYPRTRIYAALKALPGSTLAWSYLAQNNCAFRAEQAYDNTIRWSVSLATGTIGHEVGHALGMHHTPQDRNSLMYPSMNGQQVLNQTDINNMKSLGYKLRTTPVPPPPPPGDKFKFERLPNGDRITHVPSGDTFHGRWDEVRHNVL